MTKLRKLLEKSYRWFRELPILGKVLTTSFVILLLCWIYPPIPDVPFMDWYNTYIAEDADGRLYYRYESRLAGQYDVPDHYVNSSDDPKHGDKVMILKPRGTEDIYLFRPISGRSSYEYRVEAVENEIRQGRRRMIFFLLIVNVIAALVVYPNLIPCLSPWIMKGKTIFKNYLQVLIKVYNDKRGRKE